MPKHWKSAKKYFFLLNFQDHWKMDETICYTALKWWTWNDFLHIIAFTLFSILVVLIIKMYVSFNMDNNTNHPKYKLLLIYQCYLMTQQKKNIKKCIHIIPMQQYCTSKYMVCYRLKAYSLISWGADIR